MATKPAPANTSRISQHATTLYCEAVQAGRIVAGPHVRAATRRQLDDLEHAGKRGLTFNLARADHALGFFPRILRLNGGQFEGRPFVLDPSQQFIVGTLFGWVRADATRRFRKAYLEEGKGNGKSPLMAGIGMYGLTNDGEPRAEIYSAGRVKEQAMVLFRDAVAMRDLSPELSKRLTRTGGEHPWNLGYPATSSFFRPLSSARGKAGPRPHMALVDELHEHDDDTMLVTLERGFKWRRQPLIVIGTNSGTDPNSICGVEHDLAVRVAHQELLPLEEADEIFSYVCALDEEDDPLEDEACWPKANPLLGVTIKASFLKSSVAQAKNQPSKRNEVLRLHFCTWTDAATAWLPREAIQACLADFDPMGYAEHTGLYGAADLAERQDLLACAFAVPTGTKVVERHQPDGSVVEVKAPTLDLWTEQWTPGDTLMDRKVRDKAPYDHWRDAGFLYAPPGQLVRLDYPAARVAELHARYRFLAFCYDDYAFNQFRRELEELRVSIPLVSHPQGGKRRAKVPEWVAKAAKVRGQEPPLGLWMPGSVGEFELMILERRVRIRRNPVTIAALTSAVVERDAMQNPFLVKAKSRHRIDPAVAAAMVAGLSVAGFPDPSGALKGFLQSPVRSR
jgi:phage terminase large subunit-like protein